ncbi:MAG: CAAD domain-containing protein [Rhizonema sp. PD37]|nr:CAAD domain-containing protein [Rhizonema sp. PD37]
MDAQGQKQEDTTSNFPLSPEALENLEAPIQPLLPPAPETGNVERISRQVSEFLAQLPNYIARFVNEYKLPVVSFVLLLATIITLRVVLAVLQAFSDIPLIRPTFELIGFGYVTWFTFRYLLKSSTRQELATEINSLKKQILKGDIS